jgi:ankyrin repeat protein
MQENGNMKALHVLALSALLCAVCLPAQVEKSLGDQLFAAIDAGHGDEVQSLLRQGVSLKATNKQGKTPLIVATEQGNADIVIELLDGGANIEQTESMGYTPLADVVLRGNVNMAGLLLERGANVEARNYIFNWVTPLHIAVLNYGKQEHANIVGLLLDRGAQIEDRDSFGDTALLMAVPSGKAELVKLLLDRGADTDAESRGQTALDKAIAAHRDDLVELLEPGHFRYLQLEQTQWKDSQEHFSACLRALQDYPRNAALRKKVIELAAALPALPPIPEEARQLVGKALQRLKLAGTPAVAQAPINMLRRALVLAPWWRDPYYSLACALQGSGQYADAIRQMNTYLDMKPSEADAAKARARLAEIRSEKKVAAGR